MTRRQSIAAKVIADHYAISESNCQDLAAAVLTALDEDDAEPHELTVVGLTVEQEIRARALEIAAGLPLYEFQHADLPGTVLRAAERFADFIDGDAEPVPTQDGAALADSEG